MRGMIYIMNLEIDSEEKCILRVALEDKIESYKSLRNEINKSLVDRDITRMNDLLKKLDSIHEFVPSTADGPCSGIPCERR